MDGVSFVTIVSGLALMIPITAVITSAWQKTAKMRLEEARLRAGVIDGADVAEVEALRGDVAALRGELEQVQERLDFTERLLVEVRDRQQLPPTS